FVGSEDIPADVENHSCVPLLGPYALREVRDDSGNSASASERWCCGDLDQCDSVHVDVLGFGSGASWQDSGTLLGDYLFERNPVLRSVAILHALHSTPRVWYGRH